MAILDLVQRRGAQPIRLALQTTTPQERRIATSLPGAVLQEDKTTVTFPPDPWMAVDLETALGDAFHETPLLTAWRAKQVEQYLSSQHAACLGDAELPKTVLWSAALHPYQRVGVNWLRTVGRGILADDPGLGKTLQALSACVGQDRVLVSTLASVKSHWAYHIENWLNHECTLLEGTPKQRQQQLDNAKGWIIINHEMLRSPQEYPRLFRTLWDTVILDEAHKFQGRESKQSLGAERLRSQRLYLLSGTPIWNQPDSIWHLLKLLEPLRFSSYWRFVEQYCDTEESPWGIEVKGVRPEQLPRLRAVLAPFVLRRSKEAVLPQLPAKRIQAVQYEPTTLQRQQLVQMKRKLRLVDFNGDTVKAYQSALTALVDMRKLLDAPTLVGLSGASPKDAAIDDLLDSLLDDKRKVIIFVWHKSYAEYLQRRLSDTRRTVTVTGDMSVTLRNSALEAFRESTTTQVLIATIGAVGTGIDLVEATAAIFAEAAFTPALNLQAEDRLHRIGQTTDVMIYRLQAPRSVESAIWTMVEDKADTADNVLAVRSVVETVLAQPDV